MIVGSHVINEHAFDGLTVSEARKMLKPFSESVQNRMIEALKKGKYIEDDEKPKGRSKKKEKEEGGE